MPVTTVPLTDADREKIIWRVGGSLFVMRLTIFLLVASLLVALYYSMQMYTLHLGFRLVTAFVLSAAALAATVYYNMFAKRMRLDTQSNMKKAVIGMVVGGVKTPDDHEQDDARTIQLDIGRQTIPIRFNEILIVDKEMYRSRYDFKLGDVLRADFSEHGDLLLNIRYMVEDDYDLFDEDAFDVPDIQEDGADIGVGA